MLKKILLPIALLCWLVVPALAATDAPAEKKEAPWAEIFPDGLIRAGQKANAAKKENVKLLDGKFVGLYSSAKWCGFCHYFTPQLVKFLKKNKADFEVVFLSADKTEEDMRAYAKQYKMKWLAVPFGKKAHINAGGGGLPHLAVLTPDGKVLTHIGGASKEMKAKIDDPRLFKDLREKMDAWRKDNAAAK